MKIVWMVIDWVLWRWNLPATQRETAEQLFRLGERNQELWLRCERAEAKVANLEAYVKEWNAQRALDGGFPNLAPAQIERLAWLAEECGEVVQCVGKILRHGYHSASPFGGPTNRVQLEKELAHVQVATALMQDERDLRPGDMKAWRNAKRADAPQWMHYQKLVDSKQRTVVS